MTNNYANPWARVLAGAVNCLLSLLVTLAVLFPVFSSDSPEDILSALVSGVVALLYIGVSKPFLYSYMISRFGGTPGDLLVGIAVVGTDGKNLRFTDALFRTFVGSAVSWTFMGLGYIWIFVDEKYRGWHDIISKSEVVKKRSYVMGIAGLLVLLTIDTSVISKSVANINTNFSFYKEAVQDIITEMNMNSQKDSDGINEESENPENQIDLMTFKSDNPDFSFTYPDNYKIQVISDGQNGTPVYLYLDSYPAQRTDISIVTEKMNTDYVTFVKNKRRELCPTENDLCGPPVVGLINFDYFESFANSYYSHVALIPDLAGEIVYVISMKAGEPNKRLTLEDVEIIDKLIYSFRNDYVQNHYNKLNLPDSDF